MSQSGTDSGLEKAIIEVVKGESKGLKISAKFNPTEYDLDKSINYADQSLPGFTSPVTQFVGGDAETLTMELFFDTYEDRKDVREEFTKRIDSLLEIDGDLHAPPICKFIWGNFNFKCVLQSARKQFTMFQRNGTPVRARVTVTFKEYKPPDWQRKEKPRKSADKTKVRRIQEGETLWLIAAQEYGDPQRWRPIADENDVENPRVLRPGEALVVPALEP